MQKVKLTTCTDSLKVSIKKLVKMQEEIWKDVKGYEGLYKVSSFGNIKGVDRVIKGRHGKTNYKGKVLGQHKDGNGYWRVKLCNDGVQISYSAHRIIAKAFHKNPENKETVNHIDGVKENNKASNLEWCTRQENIQHSYDTKLNIPKKGEKHHNSKLTNKEVLCIKEELLKDNCNQAELARKYKVTPTLITNIKKNKIWKTIK